MFDSSLFRDIQKQEIFFNFIASLKTLTKNAIPTKTHLFIKYLKDINKLGRCYTQNIDNLEARLGRNKNWSWWL